MEWIDPRACIGNGKIFCLENRNHAERLMPALYILVALNNAEQALDMLYAFCPRKRASASLRGRRESETSQRGYTMDDQAFDIKAAVKASSLAEYCLMSHSLGVLYAIRFAARHSGVEGLIISHYPKISKSWAERILEHQYKAGKEQAISGIQMESRHIEIYEELAAIKITV